MLGSKICAGRQAGHVELKSHAMGIPNCRLSKCIPKRNQFSLKKLLDNFLLSGESTHMDFHLIKKLLPRSSSQRKLILFCFISSPASNCGRFWKNRTGVGKELWLRDLIFMF